MILMFEYDNKNWKHPYIIEKIGPMTRIIWGWWSIAYFSKCGLNDVFKLMSQKPISPRNIIP